MRTAIVVLVLLFAPLANAASAQDHPYALVEFTAGWMGFVDDGIVSEVPTGGAFRWYLSPRVSIGPEALFVSGENHSHFVLTGNATFDLLRGSVRPFLVVGAGVFQTREQFFNEPFTSNEGAFTAGGGVRGAIGSRVTAGIEARIGWEPHLRITGVVGVRLGR
jgi:hypothetical protein